jgi:hypothetical protein
MPTPSKKMHQNCIDFCVLSWDKGKEEWRGLEHIRPGEFYNEGLHPSLTTDSHVTVIFADADKVRECPSCRKCFTDEFLMPELWWSSYSRRSNGYFGSETFRDNQGDISALSTIPSPRNTYLLC